MLKTDTSIIRKLMYADQVHNPPKHPHWSLSVKWRPDRWDMMNTAPKSGPIFGIRGRTHRGVVLENMHYACGDGDGLMPPFDGWFVPDGSGKGFNQVFPVEWQPMNAG